MAEKDPRHPWLKYPGWASWLSRMRIEEGPGGSRLLAKLLQGAGRPGVKALHLTFVLVRHTERMHLIPSPLLDMLRTLKHK